MESTWPWMMQGRQTLEKAGKLAKTKSIWPWMIYDQYGQISILGGVQTSIYGWFLMCFRVEHP
jgi:endonuclease YncB( thermonuclease family)